MGSQRANSDPSDGRQLDEDIGHLHSHHLTEAETARTVLSVSPEQEYSHGTGRRVPRPSSASRPRSLGSPLGPRTPASVKDCRPLSHEAPPATRALAAAICAGAQSRRTRLATSETIFSQQYPQRLESAASATAYAIETIAALTTTSVVVYQGLRSSMATKAVSIS